MEFTNGRMLTSFSKDLLQGIGSAQKQQFVFSPYSIFSALLTAYLGANSDTRIETARVMGMLETKRSVWKNKSSGTPPANDLVRLQFEQLQTQLAPIISSLNAILLRREVQLVDGFRAIENTQTVVWETEQEAAQSVNQLVHDATHGMIKKLLDAENLNQLSQAIILNAICFQGDWLHAFEPENTFEQPFEQSDGNQTTVEMMNQTEEWVYCKTGHSQFVTLGYQGPAQGVAIIVELPEKKRSEPRFEFLNQPLNSFFDSMRLRKVNLSLPKFEQRLNIDLNEVLHSMGMIQAFDPQQADFSHLFKTPNFISKISHEAMVQVDETGTKAAAATSVLFTLGAADPEPTIEFRADHTFGYAIFHLETGTPLFIGKYNGE